MSNTQNSTSTVGFLNFGTIDILGENMICYEGLSYALYLAAPLGPIHLMPVVPSELRRQKGLHTVQKSPETKSPEFKTIVLWIRTRTPPPMILLKMMTENQGSNVCITWELRRGPDISGPFFQIFWISINVPTRSPGIWFLLRFERQRSVTWYPSFVIDVGNRIYLN